MIYEYWYAGISGLNCMKKKKLREILKTAEMIYYIEEIKLTELGILTDREIQALIKAKKQQDIKKNGRCWKKKISVLFRIFRKNIQCALRIFRRLHMHSM